MVVGGYRETASATLLACLETWRAKVSACEATSSATSRAREYTLVACLPKSSAVSFRYSLVSSSFRFHCLRVFSPVRGAYARATAVPAATPKEKAVQYLNTLMF